MINNISGIRIKNALKTMRPVNVTPVRMGRDNDGGYIFINDIDKNDYVISMGVADDVSFEKDISGIVGFIDIYDYSIDSLPDNVNNSVFFKEKIGSSSGYVLERIPKNFDSILKIDIEGGEWEFFRSLSEEDINRFRQIVVEIHWMIDDGEIYIKECPVEVIEKINNTHQIISVHPNNNADCVIIDGITIPKVLELTFLRRTSYQFINEEYKPSHLFMDNNIEKPSIENFL